ncbi:MAG: hypothetical protein K8I00_09535 [Candidatus Omnitrophica bacterium]|nr:hypothetical protein [Candidatus Omnitrophota bacterium]
MVRSNEHRERQGQYLRGRNDSRKAVPLSGDIPRRSQRHAYLLKKARYFLSREQFDLAAMVAWHILYELDSGCIQAKKILLCAYRRIFCCGL